MSQLLYPWKKSPVPLDRRLAGPKSQSGYGGKEKKNPFFASAGN